MRAALVGVSVDPWPASVPDGCTLARVSAAGDDESLMQAYVRGDQRAFDALFERYAPLIVRIGRRHLGSDDAARELVQQTFLRVHGARRDYRVGQRLHPWLMTIVMNLVRDQWRQRRRRPTTNLDDEPGAHSVDAGAGLERRDRADELQRALAQLTPGQREVVELHWLQEQPFSEVANIVGVSEGTARVRAHRAYQQLKRLLRAPGGSE